MFTGDVTDLVHNQTMEGLARGFGSGRVDIVQKDGAGTADATQKAPDASAAVKP